MGRALAFLLVEVVDNDNINGKDTTKPFGKQKLHELAKRLW